MFRFDISSPGNFIGREKPSAWLLERFVDRKRWEGPIIVTGKAGIGKTGLVAYIIARQRLFMNAVWPDVQHPDRVDEGLSEYFDFARSDFGSDTVTVVLDGLDEHSPTSVQELFKKVQSSRNTESVIITSRHDPGLERAEKLDLRPLTEEESAELFQRVAKFKLAPEPLDQVFGFCGGYPAGLVVLAGVLRTIGVSGLTGFSTVRSTAFLRPYHRARYSPSSSLGSLLQPRP